jgi:non-heme chloroperoxidase
MFKKICSVLILLAAISSATLHAQDISGDWQGTLKAGQDLRIIVHIEKLDSGLTAKLYSIDQGPDSIPVNSVTFQNSTPKLGVDLVKGAYEGKLSTDGQSITGTWTQGLPLPLDLHRATKQTAWQRDVAPHKIQFVTVDTNVKLEVLDWGGSGRPLVLLAGLGNTAHIFDTFAQKLIPAYHVYGITRRGFGESSAPDSGYLADRLGDDVLTVIDSLKLNRPILVGHSIAGEELSSIGSRHPEKAAGLIYLDAGYEYAFYNPSRGNLIIDSIDVRKKLEKLLPGKGAEDTKELVNELLQTSLPQLEKDLQEHLKDLQASPDKQPQLPTIPAAVIGGEQKYTDIRCPVLAIYAVPHSGGAPSKDPAAAEARDLERTEAQARAFESGVHSSRVVRLPHANHFVFISNEADVLREMNTFISTLP